MARDVEFNYTASDKTGTAATSAQRRIKQTADSAQKENDKLSSNLAKGVVSLANTVSPKLGQALTRGFASAAEVGPQLLVGGIVAAAPLAASLLSAAVIGGVGAGGIVGGFALAAKDPRVTASFADMKGRISEELTDAAKPFVDVSIEGIGKIGSAVEAVHFDKIFAKSAQNAEPLIDGVASAVRELGGAVEVVIDKSGPVFDQLGASITELSTHTADFLQDIAGGSEGAAAGLKDVTDTVDTLLDVLGPSIEGLTKLYGLLSKIGVTGHLLSALLGPIGLIGDGLKSAGIIGEKSSGQMTLAKKGLDSVAVAAAAGADPLATFTDQVDKLASSGRSLFDSTTQVGAALDAVTTAAEKNGKTLDASTSKGRANRDALSQLAGALVGNYDAYVKLNGEGAKSNGIAASNRSQFVKLAGQFGLSKSAADRLASSMGLIPAKKKTDFTANTHDAEARAEALREKINGIPISKTVRVTLVANVNAAVSKINNALSGFGHLFDASNSFAFAAPGSSSAEPARQVQVSSDVTSNLFLDGSLVYANTKHQVRASSKRDAWRGKVGRR